MQHKYNIEPIEMKWPDPVPFRVMAVDVTSSDRMIRELPSDVLHWFGSYTHVNARRQAIASEWLKQVWLPRELGVTSLDWRIGPHGKPELLGKWAHIGVNFSHSADWIVIALAFDVQVGVDVQIRRSRVHVKDVARLIFSESEQQQLPDSNPNDFFCLWTKKEALLKSVGGRLADRQFRKRTRLDLSPIQTEPETGIQVYFQWIFGQAYALSVAIAKPSH